MRADGWWVDITRGGKIDTIATSRSCKLRLSPTLPTAGWPASTNEKVSVFLLIQEKEQLLLTLKPGEMLLEGPHREDMGDFSKTLQMTKDEFHRFVS